MQLKRLSALRKIENEIKQTRFGLEIESLRIDAKGHISEKPHPHAWGHPLTHPNISTDYAEAQLEFRTRPHSSIAKALKELKHLKQYALNKNPEFLWPLSMPPEILKEPAIAFYGDSFSGKQKVLYRKGLKERYGYAMQLISGTHFNFSFSQSFWEALHQQLQSKTPLDLFISEQYFHLIRNFFRYGWLLTYLFGASPTCDKSFGAKTLQSLDPKTSFLPFATSLRMGPEGYYSRVQAQLAISFNSLEAYVHDLQKALNTSSPAYEKIREQINANILQIENEHYTRIRPKPNLKTIHSRGVHYLEVRAIDIDPYSPMGISEEQLQFTYAFLLYCLSCDSPPLTQMEMRRLCNNQCLTAKYGRMTDLFLDGSEKPILLKNWALQILEEMKNLPLKDFLPLIQKAEKAVHTPSLLPSAKILKELEEKTLSHQEFGLMLAKKHANELKNTPLSKKTTHQLEKISLHSFVLEKKQKTREEFLLPGYEDLELSTQILIRTALKNQIDVEVLDRKENYLRLKQGNHIEEVKQATYTRLDHVLNYQKLKSKHLTKLALMDIDKNSHFPIRFPLGECFSTLKEAELSFGEFAEKKIVVKPNDTNFGLGVHFVKPNDIHAYKEAVKSALKLSSTVLVEEFIAGDEFRITTIGDKILGVIYREPANVVGDGKQTIKQLIREKNHHEESFKIPCYHIQLKKAERAMLASQKLSLNSIPKQGEKIYLRENSNVSTGGDPIDVTDQIHSSYKQIALEVAQAMGLCFCGLDLILSSPTKPANASNYAILEVNYNPALHLHAYPYKGTSRPVGEMVLAELGFTLNKEH